MLKNILMLATCHLLIRIRNNTIMELKRRNWRSSQSHHRELTQKKNKQNQKPINQLDRYGTKDHESRPHQSYFRRNLWLREWQRCAISGDNLQLQQRWRWWWICSHLGSWFFREITPQPVNEFSIAMTILTDNTGDDTC